MEGLCEPLSPRKAPCETCYKEEQAEEICEGGIGAVICFCCLFLYT